LWLEHFERLDVDVAVSDQLVVGLSSLVVGHSGSSYFPTYRVNQAAQCTPNILALG
jgi:hypothetical protein